MRLSVRASSTFGAAATASLVLALAGCIKDTTGTNFGPLSRSQLFSIGSSVGGEAEGATAFMTMGNLTDPVTTEARVLRNPQISAMRVPFSAATDPDCPSYDPDPFDDTDADGVPDQVAMSFDCHVVDPSGFIINVTGDVDVEDPSPSDSGLTMTASASNFVVAISTSDGSAGVSQARDGNWSVVENDGGITETWNLISTVAVIGQPDLTISSDLSAVFTPTVAGSILMGNPLPAGSLTADGTVGVNDGAGGVFTLTLSTTSPLTYAPGTCAGQPASFTSGEVHAQVTVNGQNGYVRVVWANCQAGYSYVQTS